MIIFLAKCGLEHEDAGFQCNFGWTSSHESRQRYDMKAKIRPKVISNGTSTDITT